MGTDSPAEGHNDAGVSDDEFLDYRQKLLEKKEPMKVRELLVLLMNQQPDALVVLQDSDGVLHALDQVIADGGATVEMRWR